MTALTDQPIATRFSKAANTYNQVASIQRQVGHNLLTLLANFSPSWQPTSWLDLGCGTGYFCQQLNQRYPLAKGVGLDLAQGMLQQASQIEYSNSKPVFICAAAEQLPLVPASQNLVFSNFVFQWCNNPSKVFEEAFKVLKPGGVLVFSSPVTGSLAELTGCYQQLNKPAAVNSFRSLQAYQQASQQAGFDNLSWQQSAYIEYYPSFKQLLLSLKLVGANHLHQGRAKGLTGRTYWQKLEAKYEKLRTPRGLPLTWQLVEGLVSKPA